MTILSGLRILGILATLTGSGCDRQSRTTTTGSTTFVLINHSGENLWFYADRPTPGKKRSVQSLEDDASALVQTPMLSHECRPTPPESLVCIQVFRNDTTNVAMLQLVYQILPRASERWILNELSSCSWSYEQTVEREDLAPVPDSAQCWGTQEAAANSVLQPPAPREGHR